MIWPWLNIEDENTKTNGTNQVIQDQSMQEIAVPEHRYGRYHGGDIINSSMKQKYQI